MPDTSLSRERMLHFARTLPATPAVLGKLQHLLSDTNSGLDEVCILLKRDMALSARVIQISNSAFFSPALPHTSLEEAVGCVGYDSICKVVGLTVGSQLYDRDLHYCAIPSSRLWENTLVCALAMESLAQFIGIDPRSAYTTGLMRSLGKLVLDRLAAEMKLAPYPAAGEEPLASWETAAFGWDNPGATALLLEEWNFSGETVEAVRRHYQPESAFEDAAASALLLNFAARIADELGHGLPGEASYWQGLAPRLPRAGLSEAEFELCREETRTAFDQIRYAFADPARI